jgi:carboxylate-amine ligase
VSAEPEAHQPSDVDLVGGLGDRPLGSVPWWARWNDKLDQRYTLGVEEELMLLEPGDWSLAQSSDHVLRRLSDELSPHASPETHAAVLELATGIRPDVDGVVAELTWLRRRLAGELGGMGLSVAAAGTHPLTVREETEVSGAVRYRALNDSMRVLARREPTMALHVHVGVPAPEDAIRLLNGLRRNIPVLLALSANSPFWQARESGFASARTVIFQAFPRSGPPRFFAGYEDYVETVDALIASGAIPDPSPLVALIQSLARLELEGEPSSVVLSAEVLGENRFLAARDGMDARLIDPAARRLIPVREMLDPLLAECRPHALALGCAGALDRVQPLAAANGAARQRAFVALNPRLDELVASLADHFLASDWHADAAREAPRHPSVPTERSGICAAGSHTQAPPS